MLTAKLKKADQLKTGVIISYAQMAISVVISLIYTPYILKTLGDSEYGLWQTVMSSVSMLSILSLGFNSSYIRYYSIYRHKNDQESIYKLNGLFLLLFSILGLVVLACGLFLTFNLRLVFDKGLTDSEYTIARTLMIIATFNMALAFPKGVFINIVTSHERYILQKSIAAIQTVVDPIANVLVLALGYRSVGIVVVSLLLNVITFVLYALYDIRRLHQKFIFQGFDTSMIKNLFKYTSFILITMIVDIINNKFDKVILARFCGTAEVTLYSLGSYFNSHYTNFSTSISGIFTPRVHKLVLETRDDKARQRQTLTAFFIKVGRVQLLLLALIMSGFLFFGKAFIARWAGAGRDVSYWVAIVMMLPATIPLTQNIGIEIQRAENKHQLRSYIYGGIAILNLVSSIYLAQIWGAFGAALCTGVASLIGNGLIMDIIYDRVINIDMKAYWKNSLRMLAGMIPAFVCGIAMMMLAPLHTYPQILSFILLYVIIYCISVWKLSMNSDEQQMVKNIIKKILPEKHHVN